MCFFAANTMETSILNGKILKMSYLKYMYLNKLLQSQMKPTFLLTNPFALSFNVAFNCYKTVNIKHTKIPLI